MNRLILPVLVIIGFANLTISAEEIDITDRKVTDPLLKITTSQHLLPEREDDDFEAKRDETSKPPKYSRLLGKRDVIMLHPFNEEKAAEIDFSEITSKAKGKLRIVARNHPGGDFKIEILVGGKVLIAESVGKNDWERFTVPFDREAVVLRNVANGWQCEHAFLEYSISKEQ